MNLLLILEFLYPFDGQCKLYVGFFFTVNIGIHYLCLAFWLKLKNKIILHREGSQFHLFQILMGVCGKALNAGFL